MGAYRAGQSKLAPDERPGTSRYDPDVSTTEKRPPSPADVKRYRENYQGEVDGVELYRRLARAEKNPERSQIFLDLAVTETRHMQMWRDRLGARAVLPMVSAMESTGFDNYMSQAEAGPSMARDERSHSRTLSTMYSPGGETDVAGIARGERWHRVD